LVLLEQWIKLGHDEAQVVWHFVRLWAKHQHPERTQSRWIHKLTKGMKENKELSTLITSRL